MEELKKQIDIRLQLGDIDMRLQLGDVFRRYIEKHKMINPLPWGESVDKILALLNTTKCIAATLEECPWGRDNMEFRQKWLDIHKDYQEKSRQLINHWQERALTAEGINEKSSLDGWEVEVDCPDQNAYVGKCGDCGAGKCMDSGKILIPLIEAIAEKREGQLKFKKEKS